MPRTRAEAESKEAAAGDEAAAELEDGRARALAALRDEAAVFKALRLAVAMIPLLFVVGAGAVLELKRLVQRPLTSRSDIRHNEDRLRQLLEEAQAQLAAERRDLICSTKHEGELAQREARLQEAAAALERENEALQERAEELSTVAQALLDDKAALQAQVEANSRDAAAANEALASLRTSVANAFDRFGKGELPAEGLLEELHSLGVEVCCTPAQLADALRAEAEVAPEHPMDEGAQDAAVKATLGSDWLSQLRFEPERISRMLGAGGRWGAQPSSSSGFPAVKTPPREFLGEGGRPFSGVPAIAMAALGMSRADTSKENQAPQLASEAAPVPAKAKTTTHKDTPRVNVQVSSVPEVPAQLPPMVYVDNVAHLAQEKSKVQKKPPKPRLGLSDISLGQTHSRPQARPGLGLIPSDEALGLERVGLSEKLDLMPSR